MKCTASKFFKLNASLLLATGLIACSSSHGSGPSPSPSVSGDITQKTNLVSEIKTSVNGQAATVLTDRQGMSLYTFQQDSPNVSRCTGSCLTEWPPMHAPAGSQIESPFAFIQGNDGQPQLTLNGLPLYHYTGDQKPGDTFGQYPEWTAVTVGP